MTDPAFDHAWQLVVRHGWSAMSYQILNPDIARWFTRDNDAVVGSAISSGYRVVAGTPICAQERLADVAAAFKTDAARAGKRGAISARKTASYKSCQHTGSLHRSGLARNQAGILKIGPTLLPARVRFGCNWHGRATRDLPLDLIMVQSK